VIKIIITKGNHGETIVDVRRWTLRDCLWMMKPIRKRRHYLKEVFRTLVTGVSLCSFGIPASMKLENAYYMALREAGRQHEMGTIRRISVQFKR